MNTQDIYTLATANASHAYRLATKTKTGDVIPFGGYFTSRAIAETKRAAIAALTSYPVYMIRVGSE